MTFLTRLAGHPTAAAGGLIIIVFSLAGLCAPWLASSPPSSTEAQPFSPPSRLHFFGTDDLGRDIYSWVLYGGRVSMMVGLLAAGTAMVIGVFVGAIGGFFGGWLDDLLMRLTEFFQVMPRFFVALLVMAIFGPSILYIILVLGCLSWPSNARLIRGQILSLREREFVEAARAIGASNSRLILHHLIPNALPPIVANTALLVSEAILLEAAFSYLGLGDPNAITWGIMLNTAQRFLRDAWWMSVFPGACLWLVTMSFNFLADGLNDALDPSFLRARSLLWRWLSRMLPARVNGTNPNEDSGARASMSSAQVSRFHSADRHESSVKKGA